MSNQVKHWIIIKEPRKIPVVKTPPVKTEEGLIAMLREVLDIHRGTPVLVARLSPDDYQLWCDDGREYLALHEAAKRFA